MSLKQQEFVFRKSFIDKITNGNPYSVSIIRSNLTNYILLIPDSTDVGISSSKISSKNANDYNSSIRFSVLDDHGLDLNTRYRVTQTVFLGYVALEIHNAIIDCEFIDHVVDDYVKISNKKNQKIIAKNKQQLLSIENLHNCDFEFVVYSKIVREKTNANIKKYKSDILYHERLTDETLEGVEFHCDHIISIYDGYANNIPIDIISHPENLRYVSKTHNLKKNIRSDDSVESLFEKVRISKSNAPVDRGIYNNTTHR